MVNAVRIHGGKQGRRPHFLEEWAARRELSQADISREIDVDKSQVSRWFKGATPSEPYQEKLAALFQTTPDALFRHPDEDWLVKFFADRKRDEIERIKRTLETAFPKQRSA